MVVANFCPTLRDIGYMESFMGWNPIYRTEADMQGIAAALPAAEVAEQGIFRDPDENIA